MSKKSSEKLSDEQAVEKIARYEKKEIIFGKVGIYSLIIGVPATILGMIVESAVLTWIGTVLFVGGFVFLGLNKKMRSKSEEIVKAQLRDFNNEELQRVFGPRQHNKDMDINQTLIRKLRPLDKSWDECSEWSYYEGYYKDTHFSVENVKLVEVTWDGEGYTRKTVFEGAVLRCKDVCDQSLYIALRGNGTGHENDLTDPAVFRRCFSARTADDKPADDLVTPEIRELTRRIVSSSGKFMVPALIFRSGEVVMAINNYSFGEGLPGVSQSLQNFDEIRKRFTNSLMPVCELIEGLQDSGEKV